MRKRIKSALFAEQISVDIQELKTAKKLTHDAKKQAKALKNGETENLTKEEKRTIKIEFIRAKIRYKAAKAAWKAAHKVLAPYLLEEALKQTKVEKKKVKHQKDEVSESTTAKQSKVKKVKSQVKAKKTSLKIEKTAVSTEGVSKQERNISVTPNVIVPTVSKQIVVTTSSNSSQKQDNLTIIEGIGPKIAEVLGQNGIHSFKQLSLLAAEYIKDILHKNNLRLADPTTWAEQAKLAADGKMEALENLKKDLKNGKRT